MDRGRKRKIAEQLRQHEVAYPQIVGAMVRWLVAVPNRKAAKSHWADGAMSERKTLAFVLERKGELENAAARTRNTHLLSAPSLLAALFVLFSERDPEAAEAFFEQLASGAGLKGDDPILTVREALRPKRSTGRFISRDYWQHADWLIKAWNAKRRNQPLGQSFRTMRKDKTGAELLPEIV